MVESRCDFLGCIKDSRPAKCLQAAEMSQHLSPPGLPQQNATAEGCFIIGSNSLPTVWEVRKPKSKSLVGSVLQ